MYSYPIILFGAERRIRSDRRLAGALVEGEGPARHRRLHTQQLCEGQGTTRTGQIRVSRH